MNLDNFSILCKKKLDGYYKMVESAVSEGRVVNNGETVDHVYYPTTMLCVESERKVFSVELLGLTKKRKSLRVKKRDNISIKQLTLIDRQKKTDSAMFTFGGRGGISNLMLSDAGSQKFQSSQNSPLAEKFRTRIEIGGDLTHVIGFNEKSTSCIVSECMLSYVNNNVYRLRYIHQLMMFNAELSVEEIIDELDSMINSDGDKVFGVHYFSDEKEISWVKASYLMNLVLNDKIHETTIGDYLNEHSDILLNALSYKGIVYEPTLEWLEKTKDNPDSYINPDALLQRVDDYYDICDFKKGLTKRKSLTKGERRRRRFVDDVNEGLAQLDNYEEYFKFTQNAQHALDRFNVEVHMPRKILIIGNIENAKQDEVEQALRGRANTLVVDYDSLVSSYIGAIK
ncbi:Shedu anti-phage system protein SduA domain-containing protein [Klebsiella aerogenes]